MKRMILQPTPPLAMTYEGEETEVLDVPMCVIPEPAPGARNVLVTERDDEPLIVGTGNTNYLCGNCRTVLAGRVGPEELDGRPVFRCYRCGAYNEPPEA